MEKRRSCFLLLFFLLLSSFYLCCFLFLSQPINNINKRNLIILFLCFVALATAQYRYFRIGKSNLSAGGTTKNLFRRHGTQEEELEAVSESKPPSRTAGEEKEDPP